MAEDIAQDWHDMDEATYHADPCPAPSLSASIAKIIIDKTLLHAWHAHPRSPHAQAFKASQAMQIGKAVHAAVFGGADIHVIEAKKSDGTPATTYQSEAAREERDQALADGLIPLFEADLPQIEAMAKIARPRFEGLYGGDYHAERVALWRCPRSGGWRRGMLDTSAKAAPIIVDYKTTEASVSEGACERRIFDAGLHIQAAAYEEAMEVLNPEWVGRVQFYFQWQEQKPPYALSRPIRMSEAGMTLGREQWRVAGALWDAAIKRNEFPGYGTHPIEASPPPWELTRWEDRMQTDETLNPRQAA